MPAVVRSTEKYGDGRRKNVPAVFTILQKISSQKYPAFAFFEKGSGFREENLLLLSGTDSGEEFAAEDFGGE